MNVAQPLQRQFPQAFADGVADDERAAKRGTADGRPQQHAQMPAPMKAQAANN